MPDYSEFVPNVHFEQIPIKDLVSNQDYQRNLSLGHINRAAENFDLYQINPVKVSRRDGVNYVFKLLGKPLFLDKINFQFNNSPALIG